MAAPPPILAFFQSASQFHSLREVAPELLESALFVGLSSQLSPLQAAAQAGARVVPYTDLLSAADFAAAAREAQDASRAWLALPPGEAADPDLLEAVRLELLQPLHALLVARHVMAQALETLRPAGVAAAPGLEPALVAVLEYEAERCGIPLVAVGPASALPALTGRPASAAAPPRGRRRGRAGRLLRSLWQAGHNAALLAGFRWQQHRDPRPAVVAFGTGVDSVNQQRLLPALRADGRVRPLLLRAGDTDATMFNRPKDLVGSTGQGRGAFPVVRFLPWSAMLRAGRYAAQGRRWWQAFLARQEAYRGAYPFLFANPRLSPFFARFYLHLLPHALATRRDAHTWLRRLRPALLLTSNDVSFPVRTLVLEARRQGIPTLGLIHSGLNNMHYRDFRSDRMAVWGEVHVRDFERVLGKDRSELVPIGNPHYDTLGTGDGARQRRPPSSAPRVVVLTAVAQWQMLYYNQAEHLRAWQELARLPEVGIHVTIKPHPRFDDYAFYAGMPHRLPDWREDRPGISLARHHFLEEVVPACDLVVVPNLPTTAAVEAMLLRKPVLYLMCGFEEVDCCTSIAAGCQVVRDVAQVVPTIRQVLASRDRQQELVQKGQAYLDALLGPRDGQATRRLVDLVAGMAAGQVPLSAAPGEVGG